MASSRPLIGIVIAIVTAIIVVGITLLLIWKAIIIVQDRQEYKKFEKEKAQATWTKVIFELLFNNN